ncbi:MAG: hemolysin family protein [Brevinema sp.]
MIQWHLVSVFFAWAMFNFILSGFLGGSETAFLSINRIFLYARYDKGSLSAKILVFLLERSSIFVSSIVIANNITLVLGTLYITRMFLEGFGLNLFWTTLLGTIIASPFQLVVGEVFPKALFLPFSNTLAYRFAIPWLVIYVVFLPISLFFSGILTFLGRIFNFSVHRSGGFAQGEFQDLLDVSLKSGALNNEERKFINNILEFRDIRASEAMMPLSHIDCLEENDTVKKALNLIEEKRPLVIPIYSGRIDNPIGRLRVKQLLTAHPEDHVSKFMEEAFFVPETAPLDRVLLDMQRQMIPIAFVADEYGGVVGVLNVEDIVSEIVGEVIEEGGLEFTVNSDGTILADGLCDIDDLFDALKLNSTSLESKTVGGFLMEKLERMPQVGDTFYMKPWYFKVLSLRGRSIERVHISKNKHVEQ